MKLLMIYADKFAYRTSVKTLESAPTRDEEKVIENALLGFIHKDLGTSYIPPVKRKMN